MYGYEAYGGTYVEYGYAGPYGPLTTTHDIETVNGVQYQYTVVADPYGHYYSRTDEIRTASLDTLMQYLSSHYGSTYYNVNGRTYTPLDGVYHSSGLRATSSYDVSSHMLTTVTTYFDHDGSVSYFHQVNYETGATIYSEDHRSIYAGGYYDDLSSVYNGPGGYNDVEIAGYHAN